MGRALVEGGFTDAGVFETVALQSWAASPRVVAMAYCQGTPLRNELEGRDGAILGVATDRAAAALQARFGAGPVSGKIQATLVAATR